MRGWAVRETVTSSGLERAGNVAVTVFVDVFMTEIVPSPKLATYASAFGAVAIPQGLVPTWIGVPILVCEDTSSTSRVLPPKSATYAREPSAENAMPRGLGPTSIEFTIEF